MKNNSIIYNSIFWSLFLFLFAQQDLMAQSLTINGDQTVFVGEQREYQMTGSSGTSLGEYNWGIQSGNATIVSTNGSSATVRFDGSGTVGIIATARNFNSPFTQYLQASLSVTVDGPETPPNPTVKTNACGTTVIRSYITSSQGPPTGYRWYWQGKSSTSTSTSLGFAQDFTLNQGSGTYYLRTRHTASGVWSEEASSVTVTIKQFEPGTIKWNGGAPTICYNGDPPILVDDVSPSGTSNPGTSYRWQYANSSGGPWIDTGGTSLSTYDPPSGLTADRWYRRRATSCGGQVEYSNILFVDVRPALTGGSINGAQTICHNQDPGNLGNTSNPANGDGGYNYQWQRSNNGSSGWTNISGATSTSYNPTTSLTDNRWYRRRVISCGQTAYSNTVKVTVLDPLAPGSTSGNQQLCYGEDPATISSTSGASNGSGYSYQWQVSSNNSSFSNISGATSTSYTPPGNATSDRWYRRRVISCGQTQYTATVFIDVRPNLQAGSINGVQSICSGENPGNLGNATSPSGGDNSYAYQWQVSSNNSSWTDISGATGSSFNPSTNLTADRWYRRGVSSCGQTRYTGSVKVTVIQALGAPTGPSTFAGCNFGNLDISLTPATGGNTVRWYTSASGGSHIDQGTLNLTNLSVGSVYYASTYNSASSCESTSRKQITITQAPASSCEAPDAGDQNTFINGDTNIFVGDVRTYTITPPSNLGDITWSVPADKATITSTAPNGYSATIRFDAPGNFVITVSGRDLDSGTTNFLNSQLMVFVNGPSAPPTPSIEQNACGELILSHAGTPPTGFRWYWQGQDANSTSQSLGFATQFTANAGPGTYYLRTYHVDSQSWSQTASFRTVNSIPEFGPGEIGFVSNQASTICSGGNPPDLINTTLPPGRITTDTAYRWQYSDTGANGPWQATGGTNGFNEQTPTGLTADRWYRREVTSCNGVTLYSNVLQVTVLNTLQEPQGTTSYTLCADDTVEITLDGGAGNTIRWFANTTTTNHFAEGTFVASNIHIGNTYYASTYNATSGCFSNRIPVQITLASPASCGGPGDDPVDLGTDPALSLTINGDNYVYNRAYQTPEENAPGFFTANDDLIQDITYVDGVGRGQQQLGIDHSPNKADIVVHMEYDDYGRQVKEYLPYTSGQGSLGSLKTGNVPAIENWYDIPKYENTQNPYSEKEFEESPLNRVFQQAASGNDWAMGNGHEIGFGYRANTTGDDVRFFDITTVAQTVNGVITYRGTLVDEGEYPEGELNKTITTDENNDGGLDHSTEEFTNKQGQVVLKRTYDGEQRHDTYYVYDDFGNLSFVLPPKMEGTTASLSQLNTNMAALGYQYAYDHRNRLVEKQLPGKDKEYIVYNSLDKPIMTQDANMRVKDEWLFTKYDAFGRMAYTGMVTSTLSREAQQQATNNHSGLVWETPNTSAFIVDGQQVDYTNNSYPNMGFKELHTVTYYDSYDSGLDGMATSVVAFDTISSPAVRGLATVSLVKVLGESDFITTATYYDAKGRSIYTHMKNPYLNSEDRVETLLDFVGRPLRVRSEHTKDGNTVVTLERFTYDHVGRLLEQTQCVGDQGLGYDCGTASGGGGSANLQISNTTVNTDRVATNSITVSPVTTLNGTATLSINPNAGGGGTGIPEELIVRNTYDELGQLDYKEVGGEATASTALQTVDYEYNVRGWLEGINDSNPHDNTLTLANDRLWGFRIQYNDIADNSKKLYNGNISATQWQSQSTNGSSNPVSNRYTYSYDALNRITGAVDNTDNYNLSNLSYDKNGNILSLHRRGQLSNNPSSSSFGVMDQLAYSYLPNSNQLSKVADGATLDQFGFRDDAVNTATDSANDYRYDANGNMVMDTNKGIGTTSTDGITYNFLNLPTQVAINGNGNNGIISYIYDATGVKLKKSVSTGTETEYCGNYIYENGSLQFFNHAEGYVNAGGIGYDYVYQYKDHLGNVRLSYANNNGTLEIVEENNYYPFGLEHKGYNNVVTSTNPAQNYKYNGKELNDELGLDWYDYGARNYDASLGRWITFDPLAEAVFNATPYNYVKNNPLNLIDPYGMIWKDPKKAEKLKGKINKRLATVDKDLQTDREKLKDSEISEGRKKRIEKRIKNNEYRKKRLGQTITNIDKLGNDKDNTFDLVSGSDGKNHVTKGSDDVINIQGPNAALQIHELTHASDALSSKSGLRFDEDGKLFAVSKGGLGDEIRGYSAQFGFDPSSLPVRVSSYEEIDLVFLASIVGEDNKPVYKVLYDKHRGQVRARRIAARKARKAEKNEKNK